MIKFQVEVNINSSGDVLEKAVHMGVLDLKGGADRK